MVLIPVSLTTLAKNGKESDSDEHAGRTNKICPLYRVDRVDGSGDRLPQRTW